MTLSIKSFTACLCLYFLFVQKDVLAQNIGKQTPLEMQVQQTLDSFHRAAGLANINDYFSFFTPDAVFLGSDADEYWTRDEFKAWAKPYFDRGKAWKFTTLNRHVYSKIKGIAWFDELLDAPFAGIARGSGVLIQTPHGWRISQYVLSMTIPNPVSDSVKKIKAPLEYTWRQQHAKP